MEKAQTTANTTTVSPAAMQPSNAKPENAHGDELTHKNYFPGVVQPKLSIGAADDIYEKEADAMADKVMRMTMPGVNNFSSSATSGVQRKCAHCEQEEEMAAQNAGPQSIQPKLSSTSIGDGFEPHEENIGDEMMNGIQAMPAHFFSTGTIQRKCAHCEAEEKQLQRKGSGNPGPFAPPVVHDVLNSSSGRPLDNATRSFMEPRFNYDFNHVKIHDNDLAAKSAGAINALAYTSGNNIVFNSGQFNTNSDAGKRLLAHELTHVVQQSPGNVSKKASPADSRVNLHSLAMVSRQPDAGGSAPAPSSVDLVQVDCSSMTVAFYTDQGTFAYAAQDCGPVGIDLDYISTVSVDGNNVNFTGPVDNPDVSVHFAYKIEAGQPNPSTFFPAQRTVRIVTGVLPASGPATGGPGSGGGTGPGPGSGVPVVCARPLAIKYVGGAANHAFVNDPILGNNYAIREPMVSGNGFRGCTNKTSASGPPDTVSTSACKTCNPLPGQSFADVSSCLKNAHDAYASPNLYRNFWDPSDGWNWGPNSNTYAATLAKCCADSSSSGLGRVPGWNHSPAIPCPDVIVLDPVDGGPASTEGAPDAGLPGGVGGSTTETGASDALSGDQVDAGVPGGVTAQAGGAAPAVPCIRPTNWSHTNPVDFGPDAIRIDIAWDSSSGNLADLANCEVREVVSYGAIPNPPFTWTPPNPTILTVPARNGAGMDTHSYPPGLAALTEDEGTMVADQVYQWRCTDPGCSGTWTDFPGQRYTIRREVKAMYVFEEPWRYIITKTGNTNGFTYSRNVPIH